MCCQLQTLRESESRGRVKLPAVYIIPCITNIFPVLRQARIALDKPEPIQWYMLSKYIGSMRTARRKKNVLLPSGTGVSCRTACVSSTHIVQIFTATTNTAFVFLAGNFADLDIIHLLPGWMKWKVEGCHLSKPQQGGSVPQTIPVASAAEKPLAAPSLRLLWCAYVWHRLFRGQPCACRSHEKKRYYKSLTESSPYHVPL